MARMQGLRSIEDDPEEEEETSFLASAEVARMMDDIEGNSESRNPYKRSNSGNSRPVLSRGSSQEDRFSRGSDDCETMDTGESALARAGGRTGAAYSSAAFNALLPGSMAASGLGSGSGPGGPQGLSPQRVCRVCWQRSWQHGRIPVGNHAIEAAAAAGGR